MPNKQNFGMTFPFSIFVIYGLKEENEMGNLGKFLGELRIYILCKPFHSLALFLLSFPSLVLHIGEIDREGCNDLFSLSIEGA